jgi:hypothetical protein
MTQMTQSMPATGASLQFKTVTQMTQMTQGYRPAGVAMLAPACGMRALADGRRPVRWHGRWQYPQCQ